ncbi:MAG: ClbS/DfsB family four-helix bundle protein [Bacteroidota bacterium]
MARPTTKAQLLVSSAENYQKLLGYIDGLDAATQTADFPPGTLNRNIRDVLAHLHHWHLLFLRWYEEGMAGQKPAMPAPGYTWKTLPELNRWIQAEYAPLTLAEARSRCDESHARLYAIIEQHSDEELFTKKRYAWTGSTSLGAYLVSANSSHYDWAIKLIKKQLKAAQTQAA